MLHMYAPQDEESKRQAFIKAHLVENSLQTIGL